MTPEERAIVLVGAAFVCGELTQEMAADAIRDAITAEREACAQTAEEAGCSCIDPKPNPGHDGWCCYAVAAAIRARQ